MQSVIPESKYSGVLWGVKTVLDGITAWRSRRGCLWVIRLQISPVIMADFPSKVTTETSSPNAQGSQQGGNSLRGLTANVTIMMDMSFIRSIPAILMIAEIVCNRSRALLFSLYSTLFRTNLFSVLPCSVDQTSALSFSTLFLSST